MSDESKLTPLLCFELDDDSYPTDDSLEQVKAYNGSHQRLMSEIAYYFGKHGSCEFEGGIGRKKTIWKVSTGGWSGCEDLIGALQENTIFWMMCWVSSRRGGHFEFETKT